VPHLLAEHWLAERRLNFCRIDPLVEMVLEAATGRAHCLPVQAPAILPESEIDLVLAAVANSSLVAAIGRALCRRVLAQGVVANNFQVVVAMVVAAMVVAAMVAAATVAVGTVGVATVGVAMASIDQATCRQIVPVAIGGRRIMPTASTTGTTGPIIATTIGRTSTTIGGIVGTTIGAVAIIGLTAIGGTIIRATIGTGRLVGTGGVMLAGEH